MASRCRTVLRRVSAVIFARWREGVLVSCAAYPAHPPKSIGPVDPPKSFGGGDPGRARAQGAVSVSLPQVTHFSNSAPVSGSAAFAQRWAPTRHKNRSNVLIRASCSRDRRHAHTQQHSRPKGPRTAGPRPSPHQPLGRAMGWPTHAPPAAHCDRHH